MTSTLSTTAERPVRSDTVRELTTAYIAHINKAGEKRNAYGKWIITNLEDSIKKVWFSEVLQVFTEIEQGTFILEGWEERLKRIRTKIQEQSDKFDPLKTDELDVLGRLQGMKGDTAVRHALTSEFFQNIVKYHVSASAEADKLFATSVINYLPSNLQATVEHVPDLGTWVVKVSQITLNPSVINGYVQRKNAIKQVMGDMLAKLEKERTQIGSSAEIRSLNEREFTMLVTELKKVFPGRDEEKK